jgi:divalent metal cation (Fe/Co/Zn/Cd) transporter
VVVAGVIFGSIILSALSLVVRFRRASGVERQQLKWFALAAALNGGLIVADQLRLDRLLGDALWNLLAVTTIAALYVAVGIAILRYRLYEIDIIINRTLVYGSLTALLAAVYFGGVTATQAIFGVLTGQEQQPQLAIVISTLVIAALFNPLRRRIQAFIDRRFYRKKYDAAKTLEAFSAKLRDETDLDALSDDLVGVVKETIQPAHVSLWLRPDTTSKKYKAPG